MSDLSFFVAPPALKKHISADKIPFFGPEIAKNLGEATQRGFRHWAVRANKQYQDPKAAFNHERPFVKAAHLKGGSVTFYRSAGFRPILVFGDLAPDIIPGAWQSRCAIVLPVGTVASEKMVYKPDAGTAFYQVTAKKSYFDELAVLEGAVLGEVEPEPQNKAQLYTAVCSFTPEAMRKVRDECKCMLMNCTFILTSVCEAMSGSIALTREVNDEKRFEIALALQRAGFAVALRGFMLRFAAQEKVTSQIIGKIEDVSACITEVFPDVKLAGSAPKSATSLATSRIAESTDSGKFTVILKALGPVGKEVMIATAKKLSKDAVLHRFNFSWATFLLPLSAKATAATFYHKEVDSGIYATPVHDVEV